MEQNKTKALPKPDVKPAVEVKRQEEIRLAEIVTRFIKMKLL